MTDFAMYPAFATIEKSEEISGRSRSSIYEDLAAGHYVARKAGKRTLIDIHGQLAYINSLPVAQIRSSKRPAA